MTNWLSEVAVCVYFLKPEFTYEIWQDDMCVAGSDSLDDAIIVLERFADAAAREFLEEKK